MIELLLATAPTAANRLGDAELFLKYLQFINTLIAQAPRGVRPMLDKLEVLFQHLTLGGLRRWALWGAHAHRTNYEEQIKYFSLDSKESLAMLQKERKGTLLVDVQRRINMYLRALWARDFLHAPDFGRLRIARRLSALHRGLPAARAGRLRRLRARRATSRFPVWNSIAPPPRTAPRTWSKPGSRFPPKR